MKKNLLALSIVFCSIGAFAQQQEVFSTDEGAIRGYDPVAYFKQGQAIKGMKELSYRYQDAIWYFASEENLNDFRSSPEKYMPQYGGYCAYGASDGEGHKAPTQPDAWMIVNGKLYFNYNKKVQAIWLSDRDTLIRHADKNWPALRIK